MILSFIDLQPVQGPGELPKMVCEGRLRLKGVPISGLRERISLIEVHERVGKSVIAVCNRSNRKLPDLGILSYLKDGAYVKGVPSGNKRYAKDVPFLSK